MSTMPRVGEQVHYVTYSSADGRVDTYCRAATVTEVHPDYNPPSVGLAVLTPQSLFFDRQVRESDDHTGGTWHWPCDVREGND